MDKIDKIISINRFPININLLVFKSRDRDSDILYILVIDIVI